mmetsp:Transcript_19439/g.21740  ORF Transcript_19439/g.21740 Transcript_19439/m.21740 type:complete len:225 (+) Transcript_19439:27-701(+)|eukprot:CAMPEP_0205818720 /NCGR_PEP_ID=MMETSP0206-20130828/743_1 /ASSEMBLY_ACC=CAM_ASM_000279 /TAXON_ID=36767 /ORGANISM="Euplotes focardii, Strain TN1" /LENGTH=224 /DNA_ID=CAMNT_0053111387 /DNA_START=26 /DNA_END=700 /DNA_ORIENTATION=+
MKLVLALLALVPAHAVIGIDVSQAISVSTWTCLRTPGGQGAVQFAIPRVHKSGGSIDFTGISSMKAAIAAGVPRVDGYIFPCVECGDPAGQVKTTKQTLDAAEVKYGMLWLDVEPYHWTHNLTANQVFVKAMVDECKVLGAQCGIYANWNGWKAILGTNWTYAAEQGLPLWYPHYDGVRAFSDFKPFGGWSSPDIKQYLGDQTTCGVGVDYNWYPDANATSTDI